jgi:hypothetical protein
VGDAPNAAFKVEPAEYRTRRSLHFDYVSSQWSSRFSAQSVSVQQAGDIDGVAGVQFLLEEQSRRRRYDGARTPFQWNTNGVRQTAHTVVLAARDAAGNTGTSTPVSVTVEISAGRETVVVNNGAAATNVTSVTLNLSCSIAQGNVSQMRFFKPVAVQYAIRHYEATGSWTLSTARNEDRICAIQ